MIGDKAARQIKRRTARYTSKKLMNKSKKTTAAHFVTLLLLLFGMSAGYLWMPVVGFILEIALWVYAGLFMDKEPEQEEP